MTEAVDPESQHRGVASKADDGSGRRRRVAISAAALALTILLALLADRLSCRCGAGVLALRWLPLMRWGKQKPRCKYPDAPNLIL